MTNAKLQMKTLNLNGQGAEKLLRFRHQYVMTGRLMLGRVSVFAAFATFVILASPTTAAPCLRDGRYVMGTVLEVTLCGAETKHARRASETLFHTATRLDGLLTTYSADSPVSHLNAQAGQGPVGVPPEVTAILSLSVHYWQLTHRTFDITVGPLMTLWRQTEHLPSAGVLQETLARIGSDKIGLSPTGTVTLSQADMALDLGGIGKGFALDHMVAWLKDQHITQALLDFGQSSQWAVGSPPDATGWRLLIRQPNGQVAGRITLRDQALSVSGSLGQSITIGGQRYGHVIDPRTGQPVQRDLLACVIAPSAAQAEALSKAFLILGESEGIALLDRLPGVEGMLLETNGQRWQTTGWTQSTAFVSL